MCETKLCKICERELLLTRENFHIDNGQNGGYKTTCKICLKEKSNKSKIKYDEFNISDWYESKSNLFKKNWDFKDIKWMYDNYKQIDKQELLKYFNFEKNYKTLTNLIYQWDIKKIEKNDNWSDEDLIFLIDNYPNMPQEQLQNRLPNRTWHSIKIKASRLEIHRNEETLIKINRDAHIGITPTDEARRKMSLTRRGENNHNWKGGTSPIIVRLREYTNPWKSDSLKYHNYKCVINKVNDRTLEVHHLTKNFSEIVYETFNNLELSIQNDMSLYSQEERDLIKSEILRLHYFYGLGVPLSKKLHQQFHADYGSKNNTEDQFNEFKIKYTLGDIEEV